MQGLARDSDMAAGATRPITDLIRVTTRAYMATICQGLAYPQLAPGEGPGWCSNYSASQLCPCRVFVYNCVMD